MSVNRIWAVLGTTLAAVVAVRVIDGSVRALGEALAVVLRSGVHEWDAILDSPSGLPPWLLALDNVIAATLMIVVLLGGLPLGLAGLAMSRTRGASSARILGKGRGLWPHALVCQVVTCLVAALVLTLGLGLDAPAFIREPWAWYQAASLGVGGAAVPAWRRIVLRTTGSGSSLALGRQPA